MDWAATDSGVAGIMAVGMASSLDDAKSICPDGALFPGGRTRTTTGEAGRADCDRAGWHCSATRV